MSRPWLCRKKEKMTDEIEKTEQPGHDEVATAILSFNDPAIVVNLFKQLGWSYSLEIRETVAMAKQNANLSIKFKAIKHLRELLREAAEASGYMANVSQTVPNQMGGQTTFHAKRIAGMLNPVRKIESTEIKETKDEQIEKEESNRECDRRPNTDTRETFPVEDVGTEQAGTPRPVDSTGLGSSEPADGGEASGRRTVGGKKNTGTGGSGKCGANNPCIKTRPPTCDRDLFPGISSAEKG